MATPTDTPFTRLLATHGIKAEASPPWRDDPLVRVTDTCERQPDGTVRFESRVAATGELLHSAVFAANGRIISIEET